MSCSNRMSIRYNSSVIPFQCIALRVVLNMFCGFGRVIRPAMTESRLPNLRMSRSNRMSIRYNSCVNPFQRIALSTRCSEYVLWIWQRNPASIDRISASKFSWLIRNAWWKVMFARIPHEHRAYLTQVYFFFKSDQEYARSSTWRSWQAFLAKFSLALSPDSISACESFCRINFLAFKTILINRPSCFQSPPTAWRIEMTFEHSGSPNILKHFSVSYYTQNRWKLVQDSQTKYVQTHR